MITKEVSSNMAPSKSLAMDLAQDSTSIATGTILLILEKFQVLAAMSPKNKCTHISEESLEKIYEIP
jgi:hypothetical protein